MKMSRTTPYRHGNLNLDQRERKSDDKRDLALIRQIAKGDENALEAFYRLFESRIYAFALSRLNNPHASADILNEVMWAVWQGARHFEGRAAVRTWVMGITHHKILDHLRARGKHQTEELDPEMPTAANADITAALDRFQEAEHIGQAMKYLTDEHRQVLHLAFYEDLSGREISEIMDCPESTVRTRIHYAKRALRRWLKKLGG